MKKIYYSAASVILIVALAVSLYSKQDSREAYQKFINIELKEFYKNLPKDTSGKKALGQPDMAALQEYYQVMDPKEKRVPQERLFAAQQKMTEILQNSRTRFSDNIRWDNISSNMGGRTRALMWDPNSAVGNKVWAGSVTGGIWYNNDITDPLSSWQPVDDFMASLSVSVISYDPNNSQIFYAGTGEAPTAIITYRESSGRGVGIWKSINGGESWDIIPSTQEFAYVNDIEVRNENGNSVIYAAVASGKYMGEDYNSQPTDGLYRSTDGGESWEQVLPNITDFDIPYAPADIEIGTDGRIYIGTMRNIDGEGGATILYSDEGTAGSWTKNEEYKTIIENGYGQYYLPGRVMISSAPSDENIVYAIVGAGYLNGFGYYHGPFVLKSTDKGETWEQKNIPDNAANWASLSWHAFSIDVDPNNPEHFYVGGLDQYHSLTGGGSYKHVSDWSLMYYGGGDEYIHADQHVIKFKPGSSTEIIFGSDGGVFYTNNGDITFPVFQEMNRNYSSLQFYTCDIHPEMGTAEYIGGLQDNGTLLYTGSSLDINDMINGGDGAYCFFDKDDGDISIASYYYNRYTIFENGNTVNYLGSDETGTFVSPAALDYDDNILYANGVSFFIDNANTLFKASGLPYPTTEDMIDIGTNVMTWFTNVTYSPHSAPGKSTLFVGSNAGHLFKVTDAQASPQTDEIGSPDFPTGAISSIAIGGSEDTLLVTFSNYGVSSIWQTYDGGEIWREVEGNLPDMPVRWAIYHPYNSKQAIIATELGVWECVDLRQSDPEWIPTVEGMANVRVDMLRIRENDLTVLASTHGRGLYTTTYNYNTVGIEDKGAMNTFEVGPNPSNGEITVTVNSGNDFEGTLRIFGIDGKVMDEIKMTTEKRFIDLSNYSPGNYVLELKTSKNHYSKTITIL